MLCSFVEITYCLQKRWKAATFDVRVYSFFFLASVESQTTYKLHQAESQTTDRTNNEPLKCNVSNASIYGMKISIGQYADVCFKLGG